MIGVAWSWLKSHGKVIAIVLCVAVLAVVGVLTANLRAAKGLAREAKRQYEVEKAARQVALEELRSVRVAREAVRKAEEELVQAVVQNAAEANVKRAELDAAEKVLAARVAQRKGSAAEEHNRRKAARREK